ncbi:MAG: FAD-dependent oxidoreductase [Magnetococcales bacterium]|nr:FAD-dependent oxidoreductase [Magnetococcales bacterium]
MASNSFSTPLDVIVGGGVSGLTAAARLARSGVPSVIIERSPHLGGFCRSLVLDDVVFDQGPHMFFPGMGGPGENLIQELLADEEVFRLPGRYAIHADGRLWTFPPQFKDILGYPLSYQLDILKAFFRKKKPLHLQKTVWESVAAKSGQKLYDKVVGPMMRSKTLHEGTEVHADWARKVDRTVRNIKEPPHKRPRPPSFLRRLKQPQADCFYPKGGFQRIPDLLWADYQKNGGEALLETTIGSINREGKRVQSVTLVDGREIPVKNLIWTANVNSLSALLGSQVEKLTYIKTILVFLTYDQPENKTRPFNYVYYPDDHLLFNRLYLPRNLYGPSEPAGKEGVCAEITYTTGLDEQSDQEIIDRIIQDIDGLGLFPKSSLRKTGIMRLGDCMPIYPIDYEEQLAGFYREIHELENLYAVGRMGGYYFCMTPAAINQGLKMAQHLTDSSP